MNTILKYLKYLGISFCIIFLFAFFINIFNYFDLLTPSIYKTITIISTIISIFIGSFLLGNKTDKKGYLEGIKFGTIITIIMLILSYIAFDNKIKLVNLLYYLILIITSCVGSMIGINKKKEIKEK